MLYNKMLTLLAISCIKNYYYVAVATCICQFFNLGLNFHLYLNILKRQDLHLWTGHRTVF